MLDCRCSFGESLIDGWQESGVVLPSPATQCVSVREREREKCMYPERGTSWAQRTHVRGCLHVWHSVDVHERKGAWEQAHVWMWVCVQLSCACSQCITEQALTACFTHSVSLPPSLPLCLTHSLTLVSCYPSPTSISLNPPLCSSFSLPSLLPLCHWQPSPDVPSSIVPLFSSSPPLCRTRPSLSWAGSDMQRHYQSALQPFRPATPPLM